MSYSGLHRTETKWQETAKSVNKFHIDHDPRKKTHLLCNRIQESLFYLNRQLDHSLEARHTVMFWCLKQIFHLFTVHLEMTKLTLLSVISRNRERLWWVSYLYHADYKRFCTTRSFPSRKSYVGISIGQFFCILSQHL